MSKAWDDLGGRPVPDSDPYWDARNAAMHRETYAEACARSVVLQPTAALTEQELAEREVEGRERMRRHDAYFADDFLSLDEERIISKALARRLGHYWEQPDAV